MLSAGPELPVVVLTINGASFAGSSLAFVGGFQDLPPSWEKWLKARVDGRNQGGRAQPPPAGLAPQGIFVCGHDPALSALVCAAATSFSTSLGPGLPAIALELSSTVVPVCSTPQGRPGLFCGENDHNAVEILAKELDGRLHVVSCMVDRICTDRTVQCPVTVDAPRGMRHVDVTCEPYGGALVVLSPPQAVRAPPFAGKGVLVPRARAQADYLCRRKLLIVNGLHTTLAFLALAQAVPRGSPDKVILSTDGRLTGRHAALTLASGAAASPEQKRVTWCWAVARILVLLFEWDIEVVQSAHGVVNDPGAAVHVLVAYARETLCRFDAVPDTCGRVLGGGVANRFNGRILPVKTFLDDTWGIGGDQCPMLTSNGNISSGNGSGNGSGDGSGDRSGDDGGSAGFSGGGGDQPLTTVVLRACGVSKSEVAAAVHWLTSEARRFIEDGH